MADFDWVTARAECCLPVIFDQLHLTVQRDVDSMNAVLQKTGGRIICDVAEVTGDRFSVTKSGNNFKMKVVRFHLTDSAITVRADSGNKQFSGVPALDIEGLCKLMVNNNPLELWQFSRMALEDLFFLAP